MKTSSSISGKRNNVIRSLPTIADCRLPTSRSGRRYTSKRNSYKPPVSKKLSEKNLGPYEIIAQPSSVSFTLRLPQSMRAIHLVYHVSMLEPAPSSSIPNQTEDPPPPVEIEGEIEYEIAEILDTKLDRHRRCKLQYLVRWASYEGTDEETSWITADELAHAQELVQDFHKNYPNKPGLHSA